MNSCHMKIFIFIYIGYSKHMVDYILEEEKKQDWKNFFVKNEADVIIDKK